MSKLNDLRREIRCLIAEAPAVDTKRDSKAFAWHNILTDPDAMQVVAEDWARMEWGSTSRKVTGTAGERIRLPNGAGKYVPLEQLTLIEGRKYALTQRKTGKTLADLADELLVVIDKAIRVSQDGTRAIGDVLPADEISRLRTLARAAQAA